MMQRLILISLLLIFTWTLFAQDLINNDEQLKNDIIKVNYKQKNAKLAMVMSALVPGAGQFYANKKAITAYIFPVVEAGLIYGYLNNMKKGHDIENDYKNYATGEAVEYPAIDGEGNHLTGPRYKYSFQFATQDNLISIHSDDIYDNIYFRWNYTNIEYNQHFYEDIGKYNKYIFGWADWHYEYAYNGTTDVDPQWVWTSDQTIWIGNYATYPPNSASYDSPYSAYRDHYDKMRKDAEKKFDAATNYNFAIVANHFLSAVDAIRVTHKINKNYITQNPIHLNYQTAMYDSHFTPMLFLCKNF